MICSLGRRCRSKGSHATFNLVGNETGRCVGLREYISGRTVPMLLACDDTDMTQEWVFPTNTTRIGAILSASALNAGAVATALAVSNSTLYGPYKVHRNTAFSLASQLPVQALFMVYCAGDSVGGQHLKDSQPLLDGSYGEMWMELQPYQPEAPCDNRGCQDYSPSQSWYWSPRSGTVRLAAAPGSGDRCDEPGCYQLTSHLPAYDELCLARVASISNYGVDPTTDKTAGTDV
jgi:hypothetical protein